MKFKIDSEQFQKLLDYPDSIAIEIKNKILTATSRLKGLETMVLFKVETDEVEREFFAVTMTEPAKFFRITNEPISIETYEHSMSLSAGMMTVEIPITRNILADFEIPAFNTETALSIDRKTRYSLRAMLSTMAEVSKAIMDYSGTTIRIEGNVAVCINNSMCLECEAHLPDMCVSASALLSMLSLTDKADELLLIKMDEAAVFATERIVIRIPLVASTGRFVCKKELFSREPADVVTTQVKKVGLSATLKALSSFRDATSASMVYNETGMEFSMRGNGYSVIPSIKGTTIFINPRVLIVLGKFLCSDSLTIEKGGKYICLSTDERRLTLYAVSY